MSGKVYEALGMTESEYDEICKEVDAHIESDKSISDSVEDILKWGEVGPKIMKGTLAYLMIRNSISDSIGSSSIVAAVKSASIMTRFISDLRDLLPEGLHKPFEKACNQLATAKMKEMSEKIPDLSGMTGGME